MKNEQENTDMAVLEAIDRLSKQPAREVAHLVLDHISIFILGATAKKGMTAADIAASMAISTASCYKIVAELERLGLMTRCGSCRTTGKGKATTYTSVVKSVYLEMKGGKVMLCIMLKNGNTMQFSRDLASGMGVPAELKSITSKEIMPIRPPIEEGLVSSHMFELAEGARRNKMYP